MHEDPTKASRILDAFDIIFKEKLNDSLEK